MKIFLVLASFTSICFAAYDFTPIQEKSQAHSLTGAIILNDSLFSNPAGSSFTSSYSIDLSYLPSGSYSVSILDTQSSFLGGALGYYQIPTTHDVLRGVKLSLMTRISNVLGIGIAGKSIWTKELNMKDVDSGVLINLDFLSFGIVGRNLFGGNDTLNYKRELSYGFRIGYKKHLFLSASLQSLWDSFKPYEYGVGAEYISPYYFSIKGGYRTLPDKKASYWSGGISFLAPKIAFHYAIEQCQETKKIEHMVGAVLSF